MKTLQITSPPMTGADVKRAQQRLVKNKFAANFLQGDIDGVFGPETGRGCRRAKYWLGYLAKDQLPVYGDTLDGYLTGKTKLPANQLRLRQARLKAATAVPLREKAFKRAETDIGMKERPANSNRCPITERWGIVGPWCAMAVSIWYLDVGSKAFTLRKDWAYVPYLLAAATDGKGGIAITSTPRQGDIVCFDWEQNGIADHVGLFDTWVGPGMRNFKTIEGNTSTGNDSNGGQVMRRDRSIGQVARLRGKTGFIHVGR